jgi:UDP:flavonoid glycosyltransferase YjiC (YdhE family)
MSDQLLRFFARNTHGFYFFSAHPRLKLFITHGGYNSLMEAARAGVPLICMGYFADQKRNAKVVERNGWGLPFEKRNLLQGYKEFSEVIGEVLNNSTWVN